VTKRRLAQSRRPDWNAIRYEFNGWNGADAEFDPVYGVDPADTSVLRIYDRGTAGPVIAYVGFYSDIAKILQGHTPERCYPGQGWRILSTETAAALTFRGKPIPGKTIVVEKNGDRRFVLWWYNAGSRPFENRLRYVYAMLGMSSLTGRTDGSLVRLEVPFHAADEWQARQRMTEFRSDFLLQLDESLPQ